MTVKVFKNVTLMGQTVNAPQYLPETVLTREVRKKADALDIEIQKSVDEVNKSFKAIQEDGLEDIEKWRWLGGKIDALLKNVKGVEQKDIDSNTIWLAIGQYLSDDLRRGGDVKRSGTAKDHLRKCWLLFKSKNVKWIKNWAGWDALVDRGEQLAADKRLLAELERTFLKHVDSLDSRDYQFIFKSLTGKIPSGWGKKDLDLIKKKELSKIATEIEEDWLKQRAC